MKVEIKVPAMGESITQATIGNILKPSGSHVEADEEILELETDKVNQVLYAPQSGQLTLTVSPENVVKIGQVIGYVDSEAAAPTKKSSPPQPQPAKPKKEEEKKETTNEGVRKGTDAFIKELKQGEEPKLSLSIPPLPSDKPELTTMPEEGKRETRRRMSMVRRVIATRLVEAQQKTAMLTTFNEVDMSVIIELREKYKEAFMKKHGVKLGFMSFFVEATVTALQAFPDFNSYIDGEDIVHREYYDLGIAVGTEKGLMVPVIRNCDQLTFSQVELGIEEYAKKAREGKLTVDDLRGGGFTITNGGVYGSLLSTPILNPPQSAILGMHKIEKRPVVLDDQIVIRPMMYLALSYDHRLIDGKDAVTFLISIKNALEDPTRILLEV